jgi:hypothetical protein
MGVKLHPNFSRRVGGSEIIQGEPQSARNKLVNLVKVSGLNPVWTGPLSIRPFVPQHVGQSMVRGK